MGFWETVGDIAGKVKTAGEMITEVGKRCGLPGIARFGESLSTAAGFLEIAPTPILEGGQKVIEKMREATGSGDPERGRGFAEGSRAFSEQAEVTLQAAKPGSTWSGGPAPKAYERRNEEQLDRVATMSGADYEIANVINREADDVQETRRILDGEHQVLADLGKRTQFLGAAGPEGKALQYGIETNAVYWAVKECTARMWAMHNFANDNAANVRTQTESYQQVASAAVPQDSIGDFDPHGGKQDGGENRVIVTGTIRGLASVQADAAKEIRSAVSCVQMVGENMSKTHGTICQVTNAAVNAAQSVRLAAGNGAAGVSDELAAKLRHAADEFDGVDESEGGRLRQTMPPR